jgi:hypothetical protein
MAKSYRKPALSIEKKREGWIRDERVFDKDLNAWIFGMSPVGKCVCNLCYVCRNINNLIQLEKVKFADANIGGVVFSVDDLLEHNRKKVHSNSKTILTQNPFLYKEFMQMMFYLL